MLTLGNRNVAVTLVKLHAPEEYWNLADAAFEEITNGCGAADSWLSNLVPETNWGLSMKRACDIHDYMYHVGVTEQCRTQADRVFLNNMLRIIDAHFRSGRPHFINRFLKQMRYRRAFMYYQAVTAYGGPPFWKDKNAADTMLEVSADGCARRNN